MRSWATPELSHLPHNDRRVDHAAATELKIAPHKFARLVELQNDAEIELQTARGATPETVIRDYLATHNANHLHRQQ